MRRPALVLAPAVVLALACEKPNGTAVPTAVVHTESFSRRVTAEGVLRAVKATPVMAPSGGDRFGRGRRRGNPMKIAWMAPDGSEVKAGQVVVRFDPTELERQLEDGQADMAVARAKLAKERLQSKNAQATREATAEMAEMELETTKKFQSKDAEIFSRHQIVEAEIDSGLSEAKKHHAEAAKRIERSLSRSKVALIDVEKRKADMAVTEAKSGLTQLEGGARHDGILVFQRDWMGNLPRVGQQVWPGQTLAEIPLLDDMEAEVFVLEVDGGGLAADLPARLVVEAQPGREIEARVKRVDDLAKPRVRGLPVQYFAVILEIKETDKRIMKPGQRVRATLVLDKDEALVVPRQAVFKHEGKNVVYRKNGDGFETVEVVLGATTPGRVVVEEGLADGDVIALSDPTRRAEKTSEGDASL